MYVYNCLSEAFSKNNYWSLLNKQLGDDNVINHIASLFTQPPITDLSTANIVHHVLVLSTVDSTLRYRHRPTYYVLYL